MMKKTYLTPADISIIQNIDANVKNKWKFKWIQGSVTATTQNNEEIEVSLQTIKKYDQPGMAFCDICPKGINYASRGKSSL